jgi:hypothetical protein
MKLCLDSLTLTNTVPEDLIYAAKSAGFDLVSLWVQPPSSPLMLKQCDEHQYGCQCGSLRTYQH